MGVEESTHAFNWLQVVPWLLSGAAICLSWRANRSANRLKKNVIRLNEFKDQFKQPIYAALDELVQESKTLLAVESGAQPIAKKRAASVQCNKNAAMSFGQLEDALRSADASKFADGKDWAGILEKRQDTCLTQFDKANSSGRRTNESLEAMRRVASEIDALNRELRNRVEDEMNSLME